MPTDAWNAGSWECISENATCGLGGTEFATIMAARAAARLGHDVHHFGPGIVREHVDPVFIDGVWWHKNWNRPELYKDSLVWLTCFPHLIPAKEWGAKTTLLWQHWNDYDYCPTGWQSLIDVHGVATRTHERHCREAGNLHEQRFIVSPFGVETAWLSPQPWPMRKHDILYGSSPDRGLHHLLTIFPEIHRLTGANLTISYEIQRWLDAASDPNHTSHYRSLEVQQQLGRVRSLNLPVELTGHLSHRAFLNLLGDTKVLTYPCDPLSYTESFGLVVYEALASGCRVILTNADSFVEQYGDTLDLIDLKKLNWLDLFSAAAIKAMGDNHVTPATYRRTWDQHVLDVLRDL